MKIAEMVSSEQWRYCIRPDLHAALGESEEYLAVLWFAEHGRVPPDSRPALARAARQLDELLMLDLLIVPERSALRAWVGAMLEEAQR